MCPNIWLETNACKHIYANPCWEKDGTIQAISARTEWAMIGACSISCPSKSLSMKRKMDIQCTRWWLHILTNQNVTIALFNEIYINLLLSWKYVEIYYFLDTWVQGTQVFHGTRIPWKNFTTIFLKNSTL